MTATILENLSIFIENLSTHYIGCVVLSVLAVVVSIVFHYKGSATLGIGPLSLGLSEEKQGLEDESNAETEESEEEVARPNPISSNGLLKRMKMARQEVIENKLTEGMSEEQLQEEKKTEEEQLAAIYNLLIQQEDKFQINSMDDVQSQLKLYRR